MKSFTYTITDPVGIHARPAGLLVKEAKKYSSKVTLEHAGKKIDLGKLIQLMGLGVKCGDEVIIAADGEDEAAAIEKLEQFFTENL